MPGGRGTPGQGPQGQGPGPGPGTTPPTGDRSWKFVLVAVIVLLIVFLSVPSLLSKPSATSIGWGQFMQKVDAKQVATAQIDNTTGIVTGKLTSGESYTTDGPHPTLDNEAAPMQANGVAVTFENSSPSEWGEIILYLLPILIIVAIAWFFLRRTQAGMSGIMSIGRSRARLYSTERPRTTFADVAGYNGVKLEISEVVDFLKSPQRFKDMGRVYRKGYFSSVRPARARRFSHAPSQEKPACPSCRSAAPTSWRCSWVSERAGSATCSRPPASRLPRSSS